MDGTTIRYLLIAACVVMGVLIAWRLAQGKSISVSIPKLSAPVLPPSQGQKVRDHVAPIFDDMIDKERADTVAYRLYQAYKGDSSGDPVTGVGSTVKGGKSASAD